MNKVTKFLQKLSNTKTSDTLFNPFNEICAIHDKQNAPNIRLKNLELLIRTHLALDTKTIWLFEAPSHLGARRSGAPFVNEGMFEKIEILLNTKKKFQKATCTKAKTAITSKLAWGVAEELKIKPLIWESLMFHPHERNNQLTNRKPTKSELLEYKHILLDILDIINPEKVIAVGRTAEHSLKLMSIESEYVRHPAQGGCGEFRESMKKLQT